MDLEKIQEATSSKDGKYFAIVDEHRHHVVLYSNETMAEVHTYEVEFSRMKFSSDSKAFLIV